MSGEEGTTVEEIKSVIEDGESGTGSFMLDGEQAFYYTPVYLKNGESTRYMISIVPASVLTTRMQPIMQNIELLLFIIIIMIVIGVTIFLFSYRERRKELEKLAYTDSLTGGDNFACFQEKMKKKKGVRGYLIAMDISGFKIINNTCGVDRGDKVLAKVWQVLYKSIRENELAARIYADRFVMFLVEEDKENIKKRLDRIIIDIEKLSEVLHTPRIIPVIGIFETDNQEQFENSYGKAVQAKHLVKDRRDKSYAFYEEVDYNQVLEKRAIEDGFEYALEKNQFEIWYQPKYSPETGGIVGAEALVRWRRTDGTLLSPFKFIPILEKNGEKLLHYIMRLGQNLGLSITAEGVETEKQVAFLRNLHCTDIQGYYFSKPIPAREYEKMLS